MPQDKNWLIDTKLEGDSVIIVPLQDIHRDALVEAASDGELWKLWYTSVPSEESIDDYVAYALSQKDLSRSLPFVVLDKTNEKVIGSSRYCNVDPAYRRVEIGYTWYSKSYQRSPVNTECKYLLLQYAFENLKVMAVEFRTHWHNLPSRQAIERLGAKFDGLLRNHQIDKKGAYRDTAIFSILDREWPTVKRNLEFKLDSPSK